MAILQGRPDNQTNAPLTRQTDPTPLPCSMTPWSSPWSSPAPCASSGTVRRNEAKAFRSPSSTCNHLTPEAQLRQAVCRLLPMWKCCQFQCCQFPVSAWLIYFFRVPPQGAFRLPTARHAALTCLRQSCRVRVRVVSRQAPCGT